MNQKSILAFLMWLRTTYPDVYRAAMQQTMAGQAGSGISGLGRIGAFSDWTNAFSDLLKNVSSVATQYLTSKSDVDLVQQNVTRINNGLPPLNANGTVMTDAQMRAAGYSDASIATIEANMARSGLTASSMNTGTLLIAGGAVLALILLMKHK